MDKRPEHLEKYYIPEGYTETVKWCPDDIPERMLIKTNPKIERKTQTIWEIYRVEHHETYTSFRFVDSHDSEIKALNQVKFLFPGNYEIKKILKIT